MPAPPATPELPGVDLEDHGPLETLDDLVADLAGFDGPLGDWHHRPKSTYASRDSQIG